MSSKSGILEACVGLIEAGGVRTVSLDSAARAVGLSKPGLMYHFPTKEALMLGVVEHVLERWEATLLEALGIPFEGATPSQRIGAYVDALFSGAASRCGFAVFADAAYRPASTAAWVARMEKWLSLPPELPPQERARLTLARLAADGLWLAHGTGVFDLDPKERAHVRQALRDDLAD